MSALLGIPKNQIKELRILNPIILGETIDNKTCILDLHLRLNNNELINIEMQVSDLGNWPERSITYLGRTFDQTQSGGDYSNISTTMHIGILDFNLSHLTPEFYSEFRLMNVKNHEIYSDKFVLRVLNLKTLEDDSIEKEPVDLYNWAKLFKATTWEELNRFSCKHESIWLIVNTKTECDLTGRITFSIRYFYLLSSCSSFSSSTIRCCCSANWLSFSANWLLCSANCLSRSAIAS